MPRTSHPGTLEAPGPPVGDGFGHLWDFHADHLGATWRGFRDFGDICAFRFGPVRAFLLAGPDHVRHVFDHHARYDKKIPEDQLLGMFLEQIPSYELLRPLVGRGLLTSDGDPWKRQRRLAQPAFQHGRITALGPRMIEAAEETAASWARAAAEDRAVDVHAEMMGLTLRIIGGCLLARDLRAATPKVQRAVRVFLDGYHEQLFHPFMLLISKWLPTPQNRRLREELDGLDRLMSDIVRARRRAPGVGEDFLGMLLAARDGEEDGSMTHRQICDEVKTMMMAGHETTANALAFTFYLLDRHPDVAARLRAELDGVLAGRTPEADDLPRLVFTKQVLEESMRLYPPIWMINRRAKRDDVIGGYHIPRESIVMLCPFVTHRHPGHWEDPERFDPDRFAARKVRDRHRFAYFPFSGGPRTCLGATFAMLEMRLVLATLAQRFELELLPSPPFELEAGATLRPRHGLRMRLRERRI